MLTSKNFNAASIASLVLSVALFFMWVYDDDDQPITSAGVATVAILLALSIVLGFIGYVLERIEKRRERAHANRSVHETRLELFDEFDSKFYTRASHAGRFWDQAFRTRAGVAYREQIEERFPRP